MFSRGFSRVTHYLAVDTSCHVTNMFTYIFFLVSVFLNDSLSFK